MWETVGMRINISRASLDNIDAIRFVGVSAWLATYGKSYGARFVVDGLDRFWCDAAIRNEVVAGQFDIASVGERVVGVSQVESLESDFVLWKLYVLPEWQGLGIGTELLDAVKRRALDESRGLLTEYATRNERAGAFYRRQGLLKWMARGRALELCGCVSRKMSRSDESRCCD